MLPWAAMADRIEARFASVKIRGVCRFVIIRVLEGCEGVLRPGMSERSRERFGLCRRLRLVVSLEARERGGVGVEMSVAIVVGCRCRGVQEMEVNF